MNNKGFTLVEALAVIVLLGLVLSIGGYSVANYLNDSRDKSLYVFKENIKSGMINYYNECSYLSTGICDGNIIENIVDMETGKVTGYKLRTTIGSLATFGFIENQGSDDETGSTLIIKNPVTDDDITNCSVSITYNKENQEFGNVNYSGEEKCTDLNS